MKTFGWEVKEEVIRNGSLTNRYHSLEVYKQ